jgi:proteic killer suppression protein
MIESTRHKGLKLLWEKNDSSKLPPALVSKIRLVMTLLNNAKVVEDMDFPGSNLHPLKGEYAGFWTIKISGNYRLIFRFENENSYDLDCLDYH